MIFPKAAWESRVKATAVHWIFTSSRPFCVNVGDGWAKLPSRSTVRSHLKDDTRVKLLFLLILMRQVHLVHIFKNHWAAVM